jgi:hypothetical protein
MRLREIDMSAGKKTFFIFVRFGHVLKAEKGVSMFASSSNLVTEPSFL